mgnify:FL=1
MIFRSVVKKSTAKKAPAKKAVAKKSATKAVKKTAVKKSTAKKVARKSASIERVVIPAVPSSTSKVASSAKVAPAVVKPAAPVARPAAKNQKSSSRVVLAVFVGIVLLAVAVVSKNGSSTTSTDTPAATQSSSPAETAQATPTESASTSSSTSTTSGSHGSPEAIVAHYTSTGATIFWKAPADATGLTNYNVEIRANGGAWKLISTVPATQTSLDITKDSTDGWSSFRVSAVYADKTNTSGKVFGLPGQYS